MMAQVSKRIPHNAEILLVGRDGELVLQQRDDKPGITNPGLVTTFGGGLEQGETALDAAYRELHEETSLEVAKDRFIHYGDYQKNKEIHGEDWVVSYFIVKDVDYTDMQVFEGQGFVVVKDFEDLDRYPVSKLFREFAEDWFSGWRDFLFMPDPPIDVVEEVVASFVYELEAVVGASVPIVFCAVGLVGAGKTSTIVETVGDIPYFTISSDRIRTAIYNRGYNFSNVLGDVLQRLVGAAINKKVNIFFDSNAGSQLELIRYIKNSGYKIMVFYVNPSDDYMEYKLTNMTWDSVPERFTFFKHPRHVLASYRSNKARTNERNAHFMSIFPPDFVIDPEHPDNLLESKVVAKMNSYSEGGEVQ